MSDVNLELLVPDREERIPPEPLPPPGGLSRWLRRLLGLVLGLALAGGAVYAGSLAFRSPKDASRPSMLTHTVQRGEMLVTVTEDGNVESAKNVEIKCQVAGGTSILWIVKDGSQAKQGEKLVELDASQLDDQINAQKITYEKARSALVQAEKDLQVAEISVKEYLEGTFKKELQDAEAQITIALENLRTSQNMLEHSQRMFRKGYISTLELEGQQFSVQRSQLELDSARTAKDVLENFTKVKMIEDLQSKVETAKAKLEAEKAAFALEESRLKRLEDQKGYCLINAPQDGMVVYANEQTGMRFGGQQGPQIEEGATVRERQTILRLPDLSQMQVKVNVHETKVEQLRPGMRARVRILDRELQGAVSSIANQPEPTSFFSASVKEYGTIVKIDGQPEGLRPGMTAEVEILVADLKNVLTLPVAAVVEQRGKYFCWVVAGGDVGRRALVLGLNNDRFVEVKDGVSENEQVLLNPRAVVAEARVTEEQTETGSVREQFGETKPGAGPEPGGRRGPAQGPPDAGGQRPGGPGSGADAPAGPPGGTASGPPAGTGGGPGGGGPGGGGPRGGGPGGPGGGFYLTASDKDGDGKISKEEAPEFMQTFFDRVDTNGDGVLDKAEMEAMRQRRSSGGGRGGSRNLMQFDKNGDGKVTKDEVPAEMQGMIERGDANGDGAVDAAEIEQMRSRFAPGGGGGPGGGP